MSTEMQAEIAAKHVSVLLDRCIELLEPAISRPGAVVIDATLGMGGHSRALLERFSDLRIIGFDRDEDALALARIRLSDFADRVTFVKAEYDQIAAVLADLEIPLVDAVLFDLGVSSLQLDEAERGFSYNQSAALDMRMDKTSELTAEIVVNEYSAPALVRILQDFADEKFASRIASAILKARSEQRITDTVVLAELVKQAIPAATRRTGGHPAKRTFQAIRIEVNAELSILKAAIPAALEAVKLNGRVIVMSYQSLEDRIVKQAFSEVTADTAPIDMPVLPENLMPAFKLVTRGSERPSAAEIEINPRAASAKLRAVERVRNAA
jgi:16S rRNA (cytosine1402-N4)-methyltransferase